MFLTKNQHNHYYIHGHPDYDAECLCIWRVPSGTMGSRRINGYVYRGYKEVSWLELLVVTGLTEDMIYKLWSVVLASYVGWIIDDRVKEEAGI